jgi:hypothetical protein
VEGEVEASGEVKQDGAAAALARVTGRWGGARLTWTGGVPVKFLTFEM